jgi:hypothetical protein
VLAEKAVLATPEKVNSARWELARDFRGRGLMTDKRPMRRTKHLCARCADSP